jgi:hypothetical protein
VGDMDVFYDMRIDFGFLGTIMQQSTTIANFFAAFFEKKYYEKVLVDATVLHFPEPDRPFFKVFYLQYL